MSADWYPGIREFCEHWRHAPMLQQTFTALEREFADDNDACIDAAKAMVECTCRIIIENLDAPASPLNVDNPPDEVTAIYPGVYVFVSDIYIDRSPRGYCFGTLSNAREDGSLIFQGIVVSTNIQGDALADIPQMTSKFAGVVLPIHRHGNSVPFVALRCGDFGGLIKFGTPFGKVFHHLDAPLPSFSALR